MVRRERVEPIPNLTVQAVVGQNYEFGITTASVQVSAPLPIFNRIVMSFQHTRTHESGCVQSGDW